MVMLSSSRAIRRCSRARAAADRASHRSPSVGRIARADIDPGRDDDHGLVVLRSAPGIQRYAVLGAAALGEGDPGPPQYSEGGGVAAALGRPVTAEPEHVRPGPQPQPLQL